MSLQDWYAARVTAEPPPVAIALDEHFAVVDWHGLPLVMGLKLKPGIDIREQLPLLYGCDDSVQWDSINLPRDRVLDVLLDKRSDGGYYLFLRDAKKRHDAVQVIQQQRNECAMLRREVEEASKAKSRFIAGMSHEFRTPLAAIHGYSAQLHTLASDPAQVDRAARAIQRAADYLLTLVENLIEQGRLDSSDILLQPQPVALTDFLDQLEEVAQPLAAPRGLGWQREDGPNLPAWIRVDATRLRQIAINLLGNAAKFTPAGQISMRTQWRTGVLTITVADTGPGIPEADQERIFAPYERNSTAPGAGLGLTISRDIARRMGGDLSLESAPGQGSRFSLRIPAPLCEPPPRSASADAGAGRQILLVDDDEDMRRLVRLLLEEAGHQVTAVADGAAAMSHLRSAPVHCLISDLQLSGMDGVALAATARAEHPALRIVMLTGSASLADRERALNAGANTYLAKPVSPELLLDSVCADSANDAAPAGGPA